jgi:flagellar basal-body rod protein FlgF
MDNSLLVSLSQQMAAYQTMDVIANNIANVSTPAFKRETQTFQEYVARVTPPEGEDGPTQLSFVQDTGTVRDLSEGRLDATGAPYDLAISGNGYFTVQTPAGERYTRDGRFGLDQNGQLVNADGYALQGDGGAITISPDDGVIQVGQDGTLTGKTGQIGKIKVVAFKNEPAMNKEGASLYSATETPSPSTDFKIAQGMIESSNVQPVVEMSRMIEVTRAYQATATLTQSQEDLMRQAIDKLGSTPSS